MSESVDFLKIKNYAVININNMFPVPEGLYSPVDFSKEKNLKYKQLLQAEYLDTRPVVGLYSLPASQFLLPEPVPGQFHDFLATQECQ